MTGNDRCDRAMCGGEDGNEPYLQPFLQLLYSFHVIY